MSNVITSFLVGIGFSYDKKGAEQIGSGIDSIKSKALQLGSVVAGAFGIKALTADFAASKDMLGKFAEVFGVTANDVQAFGNALATEGGTLESFMAQLESIERARARIRVGDVGFFAPAGKAGINPNDIANAKSATDAYLGLADAFKGMNQQQRINAAEALGLDEASIRLLSQGRDAVEAIVAKYSRIRPISPEMTESAAEFNRQWLELSQNIGGVADVLSTELVPVINDITKSVNSWFGSEARTAAKGLAEIIKGSLGKSSVEEMAKASGLSEWMFTETWGKKYKEADSAFTQTIQDLFSGEAKNPLSIPALPSADDSHLYMMGGYGREQKKEEKKPPVNVYVGSQYRQDEPERKTQITPIVPVAPKDPETNTEAAKPIVPVVHVPQNFNSTKNEWQERKEPMPELPSFGGNVLPININLEHKWPAEIIPFSLPDMGGSDKDAQLEQPTINPADYMQHTNIVDIVSVQQKTESSQSERLPEQGATRQQPQRNRQTQDINISLNLDGAVIDKRIVRVVDDMAQTAMDDLISSTGA